LVNDTPSSTAPALKSSLRITATCPRRAAAQISGRRSKRACAPRHPQGLEHHGAGERQDREGEHEALDLPPYRRRVRTRLELTQARAPEFGEDLHRKGRGSGAADAPEHLSGTLTPLRLPPVSAHANHSLDRDRHGPEGGQDLSAGDHRPRGRPGGRLELNVRFRSVPTRGPETRTSPQLPEYGIKYVF
jgi:hypothetical protein